MGEQSQVFADLRVLQEPFPYRDIEWRVQRSGEKNGRVWAFVLAYVTNRAIQERLDAIVGPDSWQNEYREGPGGGIICGISILTRNGWVTKWDGAENTQIESIKGGLSDSMKRSAVQWGIGRYLYRLDGSFAEIVDKGAHKDKTKEGTWYSWNPPALPDWALPKDDKNQPEKAAKTATAAPIGDPDIDANYGEGDPLSAKRIQGLLVLTKAFEKEIVTKEQATGLKGQIKESKSAAALDAIIANLSRQLGGGEQELY